MTRPRFSGPEGPRGRTWGVRTYLMAMERIIGVTGHRFLAQLDRVRAGVDSALDRIEEAFPAESTVVVSMLAEGADQLVTARVLDRPASRLVAVVPLPEPDYSEDFTSDTERRAFLSFLGRADEVVHLPAASSRDEAYLAAGRWLVDHCDVLVAVWDGSLAQGPGGTADIVQRARDRGLPVAWVRAGNRQPGTREPTELGPLQGTVTFERLPGPPRNTGPGKESHSS